MRELVIILCLMSLAIASYTPVVLWHGMGDSCCNPLSMGSVKKLLQNKLDGVYVLSLMVGDSVISDTTNGFFMDVNKQIDFVCSTILNDTNLVHGYNAIGFSQGGQFLRGLAQKCPNPPMKQLISVGGQHQGVYGLPHCSGSWFLCREMDKLLNMGAYTEFVQNNLVQAQYWHDPLNENLYKKYSKFIADINQENTVKSEYKKNLQRLSNITLIKFNKDSMVVPRESEWFGFYKPGQDKQLMSLQESDLWIEDKLGLQEMAKTKGRLNFLSIDADHLQVPEKFWDEEIVPRLKY